MNHCARTLQTLLPTLHPTKNSVVARINRNATPLLLSSRGIRLQSQNRAFASMAVADIISIADRLDIDQHASMKPTPLCASVLDRSIQPEEAAHFIKSEFPIRCAERIRMIECLPYQDEDELLEVHKRHIQSFLTMRRIASNDLEYNEKEFISVVSEILSYDEDTILLMMKGLHQLSKERPDEMNAQYVNSFLDAFLLNRLGTEVMLKQYLAYVGIRGNVFERSCNIMAVTRDTAQAVQRLCVRKTGVRPKITLEAASVLKDDKEGVPIFSCIPGAISFVLQEILKNSCHATAMSEGATDYNEIAKRPISVIISADEKHVKIRVSDRAGGIPFEVGKNVWSYLYTTANTNVQDATELAGFGVGLPLSRLYTQYMGGSMNLVSLPGYGTQAYVFLPRDTISQCEVVPDLDHEWHVQEPIGEFIL
uniref:Protein-serine/threonine kinase n=1 Tax=Helicotheca tamesis TaxID=374047 RepID=A0A7S2MIY7_9STRA|mmetsp:Transcript_16876/g.23130  ORF Transcript_16876/g.23130 Transcript_16876/m.23130 type:complete len:423 (+) Transcript_16876:259-1527(+)|eukprot:CAMPEP_0185725306 /NCGR_PEP_ID=MMETSP1171-20130828/1592_1 /TAXON_ID=374046 /ORGANISM="Helicotheca tamensis, Strain CCMP826" /LENGTH=422 /DNA_ID=CAMNT_0028393397 /DNA_START=231 /DNA_END=1499 /DNA_ORIENTATION=-